MENTTPFNDNDITYKNKPLFNIDWYRKLKCNSKCRTILGVTQDEKK